jgi:protein transport protein SEC13
MIHDAQLDYYGKRLATCSSDRTIKVFDVDPSTGTATATAAQKGVTLTGHTGPVWQVAWAHPKYGSILASCSYDGKVLIWKETATGSAAASNKTWTTIKEHNLHNASVNSVSWAPHELGAIVACASSDGRISVLTFKNDGTWDASLFTAHSIGCNAVSWSPCVLPGSLIAPQPSAVPKPTGAPASQPPPATAQQQTVKRFASAGCDNLVKIWGYRQETQGWVEEEVLDGHSDWVRDVAWAPNIGLPRSYIASASQDKTVIIWTKDSPTSSWIKTPLLPPSPGSTEPARFPEVVWRVSWSLAGNILAVSCADGKVTLYKENLKGGWECVSEMTG